MSLTAEKLAEILKLRDYCQAVLEVNAILAEPVPEQPAAVDLDAWKRSQQNRVLASAPNSAKAALVGTLSTEPTLTSKALTDLDCYPSLADAVVQFGVDARKSALDLTKSAEPVADPVAEK